MDLLFPTTGTSTCGFQGVSSNNKMEVRGRPVVPPLPPLQRSSTHRGHAVADASVVNSAVEMVPAVGPVAAQQRGATTRQGGAASSSGGGTVGVVCCNGASTRPCHMPLQWLPFQHTSSDGGAVAGAWRPSMTGLQAQQGPSRGSITKNGPLTLASCASPSLPFRVARVLVPRRAERSESSYTAVSSWRSCSTCRRLSWSSCSRRAFAVASREA